MAATATGELERKINLVRGWAERRALCSTQPGDFMDHFEHEMERLLVGADPERQVRDLSDPLVVAAQIEAASAMRTVKLLGTDGVAWPPTGGSRRERR